MAEQAQHGEELGEMQFLFGPDYIEHTTELVAPLSRDGCGEIPGEVQGSAVLLADQGRWQAVVGEVDDVGLLTFAEQTGLGEGLLDLEHVLTIGSLTADFVEGDMETGVDLRELGEAEFPEALPERGGFGVPLLEPGEPGPALVLEGGAEWGAARVRFRAPNGGKRK